MNIKRLLPLILFSSVILGCSLPVQVMTTPTLNPTLPPTAVIEPATQTPPVNTPIRLATETQPAATNIEIHIDPLREGNQFQAPATVWLNGTVSRMPFEKNMTYVILDDAGNEIERGAVSVSGEYGSPGVFTVKIPFGAEAKGTYKIRIVSYSAQDGSEEGSAQIEVVFQ